MEAFLSYGMVTQNSVIPELMQVCCDSQKIKTVRIYFSTSEFFQYATFWGWGKKKSGGTLLSCYCADCLQFIILSLEILDYSISGLIRPLHVCLPVSI